MDLTGFCISVKLASNLGINAPRQDTGLSIRARRAASLKMSGYSLVGLRYWLDISETRNFRL